MAAAAPELVTPASLARTVFRAMGTEVTVLVPARDGGAAGDAAEARATETLDAAVAGDTAAARDAVDPLATVRDLFDDWDRRFSRFRPDSELSRVNDAAGTWVVVSPLFFEVTALALEAARATDGLFDPALARRLEALGYDRTFEELPADGPDRALPWPTPPSAGWRAVGLDADRRSVRVPPGSGLDFGGLVKGMAVDAAVAALVLRGAAPCAVDAGGDLAVAGQPPGGGAWTVAIELPADHRTIELRWGALATSSVARRRWRRGGSLRHHLLDPRTGEPAASGVWSASVAAASCRQAEVAAKTALLLGPEAGRAFLEDRALSGLLVLDDGTERAVGAWPQAEAAA